MTVHRMIRGSVVGALAAAVVALLPAAAGAAEWQRLPDAPGGEAFALVSGVPTVAYPTSAGVRVARPTPSGDAWRFLGGPVRREAGREVADPALAQGPDGRLWVAWTERDANDNRQVRVSRLVGNTWQAVGGQINPVIDPDKGPSSASELQLEFFEGTPYVVFLLNDPIEVHIEAARLSGDGSSWQSIDPPASADADPRVVVSGGRLYVTKTLRLIPGVAAYRLKSDKTGWESIDSLNAPDRSTSGDLADVGGSPAALFRDMDNPGLFVSAFGADEAWAPLGGGPLASGAGSPQSLTGAGKVPYAAWLEGGSLQVSSIENGVWSRTPSPSTPGSEATDALARIRQLRHLPDVAGDERRRHVDARGAARRAVRAAARQRRR